VCWFNVNSGRFKILGIDLTMLATAIHLGVIYVPQAASPRSSLVACRFHHPSPPPPLPSVFRALGRSRSLSPLQTTDTFSASQLHATRQSSFVATTCTVANTTYVTPPLCRFSSLRRPRRSVVTCSLHSLPPRVARRLHLGQCNDFLLGRAHVQSRTALEEAT